MDEEKLKSAAPFSWLTPERISDYYAQSLCYVAVSWARGGMTASAAELTEIYLMLLEKPLASPAAGNKLRGTDCYTFSEKCIEKSYREYLLHM